MTIKVRSHSEIVEEINVIKGCFHECRMKIVLLIEQCNNTIFLQDEEYMAKLNFKMDKLESDLNRYSKRMSELHEEILQFQKRKV